METLEKIVHVEMVISEDYGMAETYELAFPVVAKFVRQAGGSFEVAKDIFHDALVIFMEKSSQGTVNIIKSDTAYILGISKHLWIRKHKQDNCNIQIDDLEKDITIPDDYFPTFNNKRLLNFLKRSGKKCMDLLRAFYFQELSMKKIVSDLGYSNEHSVSTQKYKCLEKLRNTVKEKSLAYDDFAEPYQIN